MKNAVKLELCIIIPAYNEAGAIGSVVNAMREAASKTDYATTVVVVDDGSHDKTAEIARLNGATVIRHILNSGAGGATATGLSYAEQNNYDIAVTADADGQHAPKDVMNCVEELIRAKSDLLIGSRLINSTGMSKTKIMGNRGLSFITYMLFGVSVTDSQSGLRVFSHKALTQLKWKTSGYEFCSEMLWRAKQQRLKISEFPIEAIYTNYSKAKGQNNWNAFNIIGSLVRRRITEIIHE